MATTLYFQTTNSNINTYTLMKPTRGATLTGSNTTTVAANTGGIQLTATAGGTVLQWISDPVDILQNITASTITFNAWGRESATTVNAGLRGILYRYSANDGTLTQIVAANDGIEMTATTAALNWTGTPAGNTVLLKNDRVVAKLYANNIGTMAAGNITMGYNGPTTAANGDSYVTLTDTLTFQRKTIIIT